MGASESKAVADVTLDAVTDVSTKVLNNTTMSSKQGQGVIIYGGKGGVKVGNITQRTTATVDTKALMKAMSNTTAQQDLVQQMSQTAKAITSGINFGSYSSADTEMNAFLKASIDIATDIENTCSGQVSQQQTIVIRGGQGGVTTGNIDQQSIANIFQSCITNSVSNNNAAQKITQTLKQSATAKSEGLSAFGIALIIGMVILALTVPVIVGGSTVVNSVLKLFFPIMIVGGLVMIFLYFTWSKDIILATKYSNGLSTSTSCSPSGAIKSTEYKTFEDAVAKLKSTKEYVALDWVGFGETVGGKQGPKLAKPQTTFYTNISNPSCQVPTDKNLQLFKRGSFIGGHGEPSNVHGSNGDFYIDYSTGSKYIKQNQVWTVQQGTVKNNGKNITFGKNVPPQGVKEGEYYLDTSNPKTLTLYKGEGSKWTAIQSGISGPGYTPVIPSQANASAIKTKGKKPWLLWVGGATVGMGFAGFVISTIFGNKKVKAQNKK
jgi:hypothetical protein